ncbi:hypothetical protein WH47_03979 [Habropoda laboriosa]|uniref:Uncharacterized protein n=1 Tax=Habropoda laboriosa TaxID=597456 RepID=A0A0L7QUS0_9HYME|nr:hypothetical protein WH47_03979 [Habropoda laboriosa]
MHSVKISLKRYIARRKRRSSNPTDDAQRTAWASVKLPAPASKLGRCTRKSTGD